jgi:hypothetical protein
MTITRRSLVGSAAASVAVPGAAMASTEAGKGKKLFALVQIFPDKPDDLGFPEVLAVDTKERLEEFLRAYEPRYHAASKEMDDWKVPGYAERIAALPDPDKIEMPPKPPLPSRWPPKDASKAEYEAFAAALDAAAKAMESDPAWRAAQKRRDELREQRNFNAEEYAAIDRKVNELTQKFQLYDAGLIFPAAFRIVEVMLPTLPEA